MNWVKRVLGWGHHAEPASEWVPSAAPPRAVPVYTRYAFSDPQARIAAVGDLHGRIDLLRGLAPALDRLAADPSRQLVEVYLGDYVDRGGDARAVVAFLADRQRQAAHQVVCLAGNHEQMLLSALDDDREFLAWLKLGGHSTLLSYGVSPRGTRTDTSTRRTAFRDALPPDHLEFLLNLQPSYQHGGFFFAHAGVRPGKPLAGQSERDLLWIRDSFLRSDADFGAVVVHGHTPVARPEFRPNRIGIDTGAYYSGTLTCLTITSDAVSVLREPAATA